MELMFSSYQFLFTFLVLLFLLMKLARRRSKTNNLPSNLPPGPRKLPLIGNMHKMIGSLPHLCLRNLAEKHGPLMHLQLGELSIVVVSSAEMAKQVMKTHDIIFANRPFYLSTSVICYDSKDIVFAPYGDYWRQLRKICTLELLSTKRVQSFRSLREEQVSSLVNSINNSAADHRVGRKSSVNLSEKISSTTYGVISRAAFGTINKCQEYQEEFISVAKEILEITGGFKVSDIFPSIKVLPYISGLMHKLKKIHLKADQILETIIVEHKTKRSAGRGRNGDDHGDAEEEDLVDVLLRTQEDGDLEFPFTDNNIKAVILDLFIAGIETSSTVIEWAMSEMLKSPRVMKKAQVERYCHIWHHVYGDYWRQLPKICPLELLSAERVQSFRSIREAEDDLSISVKRFPPPHMESFQGQHLVRNNNEFISLAKEIVHNMYMHFQCL